MTVRVRSAYYGPVHDRNFGKFAKGIDRDVVRLFVGTHQLLLDSLLEGSGVQSGVSKARYLFVVETERLLDDGSELLRPLYIWLLPGVDFIQKVNDLLAVSYHLDERVQNELLQSLNPPPDWSYWDHDKAT